MRAHSIPLIFKIAYPYHSLRDNCFLYFIFQKEVTLSGVYFYEWRVWGKAVIHNLLIQAGVPKNVPPYLGTRSPHTLLGLVCNSLFCFKHVHMTPWQPHCYVCSWQEGKGILCITGGVPADLCLLWDKMHWPWETSTHCWGWSCSVSSLCEWSVVLSRAHEGLLFLSNPNTCRPCSGLTSWDHCFW